MTEGKIIAIVDERTLIANIGRDDGVEPGEEYVIVQAMDMVEDPETGGELEVWEMVKSRVIAMHVQGKITTFSPISTAAASQSTVLSERMTYSPSGTPIGSQGEQDLAIDRTQMLGRRRPENIRKGDVIRSVK